jgi:acylphosphatase
MKRGAGGETKNGSRRAFGAVIHGEVQGVGFRMSAVIKAESLGLTGWVRNAEDGSVELFAEGPARELEIFFEWLQTGPSYANVENVTRTDEPALGLYKRFSVIL